MSHNNGGFSAAVCSARMARSRQGWAPVRLWAKVEFRKRDGERGRRLRHQPLARWQCSDRSIASRCLIAMDVRDQADGIHHPKLGNAKAGIEVGLAAEVMAET